jgi:hypothetical protein
MKKGLFLMILLTAFGAVQGVLYAESLQGEVLEVTPSEITLKVSLIDSKEPEAKQETQKILVTPETEFKGTILDELRVGDEILTEGAKNRDGSWTAEIIQIDKVNIR